jgi:hypothetical protein
MRKLTEVQRAKELMNEAVDWSTFRWLFEKPRVREIADLANAALDKLERATKSHWSDEIKAEYREISRQGASHKRGQQNEPALPGSTDAQFRLLVEKMFDADKAAKRAREEAEKTFDEAEKKLNIGLAREGCKKAIHSWELHEKAIRKAESLGNTPGIGSTVE